MAVKIVSKELALKLKELGFDMEVNAFYMPENTMSDLPLDAMPKVNHNKSKIAVSAPTYDEVLHWLRDKHGMNGEIINFSEQPNVYIYCPSLEIFDGEYLKNVFGYFGANYTPEYEDAQLAIIKKAIEILEERTKTKEHE